MRLSCTVVKVWRLKDKKSWTHGRTHGHSGDFILCPMLCIALHWTDNKLAVKKPIQHFAQMHNSITA